MGKGAEFPKPGTLGTYAGDSARVYRRTPFQFIGDFFRRRRLLNIGVSTVYGDPQRMRVRPNLFHPD